MKSKALRHLAHCVGKIFVAKVSGRCKYRAVTLFKECASPRYRKRAAYVIRKCIHVYKKL